MLTPHKIERAVFWRYSKNGAWYQYKHGDFYAGKGAAMVRIAVEGGGSVDCFNTHCIASYPGASYRSDRAVQLQELAEFVEAEATTPSPAILLGNLNARVDSPEYAPLSSSFDNLTARLDPAAPGRIDHILVRPHPSYAVWARDRELSTVSTTESDHAVRPRRRRHHGRATAGPLAGRPHWKPHRSPRQ